MVVESSQTRTGVVGRPADPAQAKPQDKSTKANKAMEAAFRAWASDIATSCDISDECRDGFKLRRPLRPFAYALDNRDVTVDR